MPRLSALATAVLLILAACDEVTGPDSTHPNNAAFAPRASQPSVALVANQLSTYLTMIETAGHTATGNLAAGGNPYAVTFSPDGREAYVATLNPNTLIVYETAGMSRVGTVPLTGSPRDVEVSPDGREVYVVNAYPNGSITVVDPKARTILTSIDIGGDPFGMAVTPDGRKAYVASSAYSRVTVVDLGSRSVVTNVPTDYGAIDVAITPDGATAYTAIQTTDAVTLISTATNTVTGHVPVGDQPMAVTMGARGDFAYVSNANSNTVSVIDVDAGSVVNSIPVGANPEGGAVTADGSILYVANLKARSVSVISLPSHEVIGSIPTGVWPRAVAVSPSRRTGGGPAKASLCHRRANGEWGLIEVAETAVAGHLAHGDTEPPCAPTLLEPIDGALIPQNNPASGCPAGTFGGQGTQILFDWTDSLSPVDIAGYELYAHHVGSTYPIENRFVPASEFERNSCGFVIDRNLDNWEWKVRARDVQGQFGPWSEIGEFGFEPCRLDSGQACAAPQFP